MTAMGFCSESSLDSGEGIAGTASASTVTWILLELDSAWAPKPVETPELARVRDVIEGWLVSEVGSRFQLIRRPRAEGSDRTLMIGQSRPGDCWLAARELSDLDELRALDLSEVISVRGGPSWQRRRSVHLVCTHGKRDRCCSKWGIPVFARAAELCPAEVWQTSHLGGHRFAATTLSLPQGLCYGRLSEEDVEPWLEAEGRSDIFELGKLRGRTAYSQPVQAAEIFVLGHLQSRDSDELSLLSCTEISPEQWTVAFSGRSRPYVAQVRKSAISQQCVGSCGDPELRSIANFELIKLEPA